MIPKIFYHFVAENDILLDKNCFIFAYPGVNSGHTHGHGHGDIHGHGHGYGGYGHTGYGHNGGIEATK